MIRPYFTFNSFLKYSLLCLVLCNMLACKYSFKGISISDQTKTFYIPQFINRSTNVVPTLAQTFTETLKDKIRTGTSLTYNELEPDIQFSGTIINYRISSVAPQPGEQTALNRLEITVDVNYTDFKEEKNNWRQNFSYFNDFPSEQNILDVQDNLIDNINQQLVEDIFNKAFTNW
ncbi:MAG: LptE family protein [Saprospiraceae bacterium]